MHNGFCYSLKEPYFSLREQRWIGRYRCKNFRNAESGGLSHGACQATIRLDQQNDNSQATSSCSFIINETGAEKHLDFCKEQARIPSLVVYRPNGIYDARPMMKSMAEFKALHMPSLSANEIARAVMDECVAKFNEEGQSFDFLTIDDMRKLVYYVRNREHGEWEAEIASWPTANCSTTDERMFLQFNLTVNIEDKAEKIIGWGHPDLIEKAKYENLNVFIDCTFAVVPRGFQQCMVIMVYDRASQLYLPIMYILLQSKKKLAYLHAMHQAIVATNYTLNASTVMHDYEINLIKAVKWQFPDAESRK